MSSTQVQQKPSSLETLSSAIRKIWPNLDIQSTAVLMVVAIAIGLATGSTAVLFIKAIQAITSFSFSGGLNHFLSPLGDGWIILVPILGSLISGPIIAYWAIEAKGHGVPEVMQAIIMRGGRIRPRVAAAKSIASAVCIGTGGSAGREGPIVQVGAALGSTAARVLRLGKERTITLVACGAAAGIAATFNAPVAGVIFAMEVILAEFTTHYFGTVVVASVMASIVSRSLLGNNPAFAIPSYALVSAWELPLYALLGVLAAIVGWSFVGILYYFEDRFDSWQFPAALKPAVGALGVGLIALLFPQALGTGLEVIGNALVGTIPWTLLLMLLFGKLLATSSTLGSGNSGGVFSPSLFMGAMLGGVFGFAANALFPNITAQSGAYALVGMAGVFSAAAHAPLTALIIVFEMSGDYRLILPLMITVSLSTLLSQYMRRYSIYSLKLAKKRIPLERDRDVDVMRGLTVGEVMTQKPDAVHADMSLAKLAKVFIQTRHHGFPVLDRNDRLIGMVTIKDLERKTVQAQNSNLTVADITQNDILVVSPYDPLSKGLRFMSEQDIGRIPVVDPQDHGRLVGLLRRQDIIRAYSHAVLRNMENQHRKEQLQLGYMQATEILEITLTSGMAAIGRRIKELDLPSEALITSVRRKDEVIIAHGDTLFQPKDRVLIAARKNTAADVRRALIGHE